MLKLTPGKKKKREGALGLSLLYASLAVLLEYSKLQMLALQQWQQPQRSSQNDKFTNPDTM